MLLALGIVTVLIWLALLVGWYGFWRADQRLPLSPEPLAKWPSVGRRRAGARRGGDHPVLAHRPHRAAL
jgi:hypothetical protein